MGEAVTGRNEGWKEKTEKEGRQGKGREHVIACNRLDKSDKRMRMVIEKDREGWEAEGRDGKEGRKDTEAPVSVC